MAFKIQNLVFWLLGVLMIIFGLNKFLGFIPVEPPANETAQKFLGTMFTSYLFVVVALSEMLGGALLFLSKTRKWGMLILAPVVFNIVAFHIAHDFIGNGIWLLPTILVFVGMYYEWSASNFNFQKS